MILSPGETFSQAGRFFIRTVTPKDFASQEYDSGPQIMSIVQDKRGVLYFANSSGILEHDGQRWGIVKGSEGKSIISLARDTTGLIYAGGTNELGVLKADRNGRIIYQSLVALLEKDERNFGSIWNVVAKNGEVFFQSDKLLFQFKDNKFRSWFSPQKFNKLFLVNNEVYVREQKEGVKQFKNQHFFPLVEQEKLKDVVTTMLPYKDQLDQEGLLIGTLRNGLFLRSGRDLTPFVTEADNYLKENLIENAVQLLNGDYAIATNHGGLVVITPFGHLKGIINKSRGLQDDYIGNLFVDNEDGLWLCHDVGASRVEINSPITYYNLSDGYEGLVLSSCKFEKKLYIATTSGVYSLENHNLDKKFVKIQNIGSQSFRLLVHNHQLFAATVEGIFIIKENSAKKVCDGVAIDIFPSSWESNRLFIGLVDGLKSIINSNNSWIDEGMIKGFNDAAYKNSITKNDVIWSGNENGKLTRIDFSKGYSSKPLVEIFDTSSGLPDGWYRPSIIFNKLYVGTRVGIFEYNSSTKKFFASNSGFSKVFNSQKQEAYELKIDSWDNFWVVSQGRAGIIRKVSGGEFIWDATATRRIPKADIWSQYPENNGVVWIGNNDGLYRYDTKIGKDYYRNFNSLIRKVTAGDDSVLFHGNYPDRKGHIVLTQAKDLEKGLDYKFNSLLFEYSAASMDFPEATRFTCFLEGYDKKWSPWSSESQRRYTNLPPGNYRFRVIAQNCYGNNSIPVSYQFSILSPWYRSWWAYSSYAILGIGLFVGAVRLNSRRLEREKKVLEGIIAERTIEIVKQKEIVEDQNKDIKDSIKYARRIQSAIMPPEPIIKRTLQDYFVYFKPKDIVSGDFYWVEQKDGKDLFAAADCTGHGVPGAFMSIVGHNLLEKIVNEHGKTVPSDILDHLNISVSETLRQNFEDPTVRDGMDIALGCLDREKMTLQFAGANNGMYIVRDGQIEEIRADKFPIGIYIGDKFQKFRNNEIPLRKGDLIYTFSDGFADQFGGPKGKKFKYKAMQELFVSVCSKPMEEQREIISKTMESWKGELEQVDDQLIIGIRV